MSSPTPLKYLTPGWFSLVMGLCGLALAWQRAHSVLGDMADGVALVLGALSALLFGLLLLASLLRIWRYPTALGEDLRHPVRHAFVAAVPLSLLLLAALGVALGGVQGALVPLWHGLWWAGSLGQLWATLWVLGRWIAPAAATPTAPDAGHASLWPAVTPVLLIPVVGNVLAPLAGVPLGHGGWATAQMGIGIFFWPLLLALILARRIAYNPLPERLLSTWFILLAPPAVIGLVLLQMQAALALVQALWGVALFFLLWLLPLVKRAIDQPFGIVFWASSFPLAAFTTLSLGLAELHADSVWAGAWQQVGVLLLAATSLIVLGLSLATLRGLRDGSLLAPETVAHISPSSTT